MKKKIISLVLAATMIFGASMTVFATEEDTGNTSLALTAEGSDDQTFTGEGTVTLDSTVEEVEIEVTITAGDDIIANPYGLLVEDVFAADDEGNVPTLNSSTITFENASNTAVSIGLTGQIVIPEGSDVTVASSESKINSATTKMVYIQAKVYGDSALTAEFWKNGGTKAESALVYSAKGASMSNAPVLAAKGAADTTKGTSEAIYVQLTGATSISSSSAWATATDNFKVITTYDIGLSSAKSLSTFVAPTAS